MNATSTTPHTPARLPGRAQAAHKPALQPWNLRLAAARQMITDMTLAKLTATRDAVIRLKEDGHVVFGVQIDSVRPTVQIEASRRTQALIDSEAACYYKWVTREGKHERHGQFTLDGVRVVWVEQLP